MGLYVDKSSLRLSVARLPVSFRTLLTCAVSAGLGYALNAGLLTTAALARDASSPNGGSALTAVGEPAHGSDIKAMDSMAVSVGTIRDLSPVAPLALTITDCVEISTSGPPLFLADNPEWVDRPGIHSVFTLTGPGQARLFWYLINATGQPFRFTLVAENGGTVPAHLRLGRIGRASGRDYELIGQEALYRYLAIPAPGSMTASQGSSPATSPAGPPDGVSAGARKLTILPGTRSFVLPELNAVPIYQAWASVLYLDLETDQPIKLYVEAHTRPTTEVATLPWLEPDQNPAGFVDGRGTFPASVREMVYRIDTFPAELIIAADDYHQAQRAVDSPLEGIDEMTGQPTLNNGNYGVLYRLIIQVTAASDKPLGVYLTPVPNGRLATVVQTRSPYQSLERLPKAFRTLVTSTSDGVLAAVIPPGANGQLRTAVLETYPPAGSAAITFITVMPLE